MLGLRRDPGRAALGALAAALLLLVAAPGAGAGGAPAGVACRPAADFRPPAADAFELVGAPYVHVAFFLDDGRPHVAVEDGPDTDLVRPTTLIAVTTYGRPSKLLAQQHGSRLLILKFVTYPVEAGTVWGWSGEPTARGEQVWLGPGEGLDLDTGQVAAAGADLVWGPGGPAPGLRPAPTARLKRLIALPVVAHRMKDRAATEEVAYVFTAAELGGLFVTTGLRGAANTVWAPAGVLFHLVAIDDCAYSLSERPFADGSGPATTGLPAAIPWPLADCQAMFRRVNRAYNAPAIRGVDLYVWRSMERAVGYAAQHRADGPSPGPGAVWMDQRCVGAVLDAPPCHRVFAHEVGHFLGLCHSCVTTATAPGDGDRCGFCASLAACGEAHAGLLMRDDLHGTRLTPEEIHAARAKASQITSSN
jgi:hypothetical protein